MTDIDKHLPGGASEAELREQLEQSRIEADALRARLHGIEAAQLVTRQQFVVGMGEVVPGSCGRALQGQRIGPQERRQAFDMQR